MSILAGDLGGTSTRLAWFAPGQPRPRLLAEQVYPSAQYGGLDEVVAAFLSEHPRQAAAACFGVAGPVRDGRVATPNLPWVIEAVALAARIGVERVSLINDLEANAWGIPALADTDLLCLNRGEPVVGNGCVISAGTGLGQAGLYWDGSAHRPFATEGGHSDFAPRNALEAGLLEHLRPRFGRVSVERIISGPGIALIYDYLREGSAVPVAAALAEAMGMDDPTAAVAEAASAGENGPAQRAMDLFVSLYGAEAGNLALKMLAVGGVFVGGGIAPKIVERLRGGAFMEAFLAKGRMRGLLQAIPVQLILDEKTALVGAARCAAGM